MAIKKDNSIKTDYQQKKATPKKVIQRIRIKDEVSLTGLLGGRVLTLPAEGCEQEILLRDELPNDFKYVMVEGSPEVYPKMIGTALTSFPNNLPSFHNCYISDIIHQAKEDTYTHCFLDYCKGIENYIDEILYAMNNKIVVVGGLMTFTFCLRNPSDKHKKFLLDMSKVAPLNQQITNLAKVSAKRSVQIIEDSETVQAFKNFFISESKGNWGLVSTTTYKDGAPMALVIIKRIK
jgi:hypothetical protein